MSRNPEDASAMFLEGYNCAQAVLACCGKAYDLPRETAVRVAQAFGGGMGRTGNVCGAVTGAMMVLGLKHAVKDGGDSATKQKVHRLTQELFSRFQAKHGSILCRELLGCDLSTEVGFRKAHDTGLYRTICPNLVKDAAEIAEDLLTNRSVSNE